MLGIRLQGKIIKGIVPGSPAYYNNFIHISDEIVSVNGRSEAINTRINVAATEGQTCEIALKSGRVVRLFWSSVDEVNERLAVYETLSKDMILLNLIEPFLKNSYQCSVTLDRIVSKIRRAKIWSSWVQRSSKTIESRREMFHRRRFRILFTVIHTLRLYRRFQFKLIGQQATRSFVLQKYKRKIAFQEWLGLHLELRKMEAVFRSISTRCSKGRSLRRAFFSLALLSRCRVARTHAKFLPATTKSVHAMHAVFNAWQETMCLLHSQRSWLQFLFFRPLCSKDLLRTATHSFLNQNIMPPKSLTSTFPGSQSPTTKAKTAGITNNKTVQYSSFKCNGFKCADVSP